jgi:hypothetical protein
VSERAAAGVEKAKIADLRVRTTQAPGGGVWADLWVDMVITHPTVGGHLISYFTMQQRSPHGAGDVKKSASLAATQKQELKANVQHEALHQGLPVHASGIALRARAGHVRCVVQAREGVPVADGGLGASWGPWRACYVEW